MVTHKVSWALFTPSMFLGLTISERVWKITAHKQGEMWTASVKTATFAHTCFSLGIGWRWSLIQLSAWRGLPCLVWFAHIAGCHPHPQHTAVTNRIKWATQNRNFQFVYWVAASTCPHGGTSKNIYICKQNSLTALQLQYIWFVLPGNLNQLLKLRWWAELSQSAMQS